MKSVSVIRIALCQLSCHPALAVNHVAYLEEPVLPPPKNKHLSLSGLGALGLDVLQAQTRCKEEYISWVTSRIGGVLEQLGQLEPAPDLVAFPEGSVPVQCLQAICDWSQQHSATVLAGSHSPIFNARGRAIYGAMGVPAKTLNRLQKWEPENVLSLFRSGKLDLVPKRNLSVAELSDVGSHKPALPKMASFEVATSAGVIRIAPLICAEALQRPVLPDDYSLSVVISFDTKPRQFASWVDEQVRNGIPVAYCNAGQFGGTAICSATDSRQQNWFADTFGSGLPPGDMVLVGDLDLEVTAVETGTAAPRTSLKVAALAEVVAGLEPSASVSRSYCAACGIADPEERTTALESILSGPHVSSVRTARTNRLLFDSRRGLAAGDAVEVLGKDILVEGQQGLKALEASLAAMSEPYLAELMQNSSAYSHDQTTRLMEVWSNLRKLGTGSEKPRTPARATARIVLDREFEIGRFREFLDHPSRTLFVVTGLPQIGKSSTILKALEQLGVAGYRHVELLGDSSPAYLLAACLGKETDQLTENFIKAASQDSFIEVLAAEFTNTSTIWIAGVHHVLNHGQWLDPDMGLAFARILNAAASSGAKIIAESRRAVPVPYEYEASTQFLRLQGLEGQRAKYGVQLIESQLRRLDLPANLLSQSQKETVVSRVSGHPKALEMVVGLCLEEGPDDIVGNLSDGRGSVSNRIAKLFGQLSLSDDECFALALLRRTEGGVPRAILQPIVGVHTNAALSELLALGAVELDPRGWVRIANVLRSMNDGITVSQATELVFHTALAGAFADYVNAHPSEISVAVRAETHGSLAGLTVRTAGVLIDGAIAAARREFGRQNYERAGSLLEGLLKKRRTKPVLRLAALTFARLRQLERAIDLANEAFQKDLKDTQLLAELGRIALSQRDIRLAESLVDVARDAGVEDAEILVLQGRIHLRRGELKRATYVLERATKLTEDNPWTFVFLGETYMRLGQLDAAIDVLDDGLNFYYRKRLNWRSALRAIKTKLGTCYLQTGKTDLAATYIEGVAEDERTPESARAYAALTIQRDGVSNHKKALDRLKKAQIRNRFDRCQYHLFCGQFYLGIGEPELANREFELACKADQGNVFAMVRWAETSFEIALERRADGEPSYVAYASDSYRIAGRALTFDTAHGRALNLVQNLHSEFPEVVEGEDDEPRA